MKLIKYISGLFLGILLLYPLKKFWGDYFNIESVWYDLFWIALAIAFFLLYNFIFEFVRKNKS